MRPDYTTRGSSLHHPTARQGRLGRLRASQESQPAADSRSRRLRASQEFQPAADPRSRRLRAFQASQYTARRTLMLARMRELYNASTPRPAPGQSCSEGGWREYTQYHLLNRVLKDYMTLVREPHNLSLWSPPPLVFETEKKEVEVEVWPRDCPLCQDRFCHLLCPYLLAEKKKEQETKEREEEEQAKAENV
ncbi:hypothetical protein BT63DRAFT_479401 [Microthyrium microscopicum]|uniref:Uncharacterized protein n=1 Tax=Microthyrium microscopicum TaxID=703497 RepID=A0A6A6UDA3_9PEZI|nr:hypothetical protein BT63DRAFT_479401 [Microthyrium microscopicum]